jgi:AraC family transcriptional regulator, positive regulator of tynA and feaB
MDGMVHQSGDSLDTPRLDFEGWRALLRSNCGGEVEVSEPNAFAGWMHPLRVNGLAGAAVKIQWGSTQWISVATLTGSSEPT